jgi:hypothetical protein
MDEISKVVKTIDTALLRDATPEDLAAINMQVLESMSDA